MNVLLYLSLKNRLLLKTCAGNEECVFSNSMLNCCCSVEKGKLFVVLLLPSCSQEVTIICSRLMLIK